MTNKVLISLYVPMLNASYDVFIPVNSSNGPVLDMSLINFDTNIGSSSGKGKRRRK